MNCTKCGKENPETAAFCAECGTRLEPIVAEAEPVQSVPAENTYVPPQPQYTQPQYQSVPVFQQAPAPVLPAEYKPLSPWAYFGYQLLFAIPLVGFILLIVFSCGGSTNKNLKNFARSYFCGLAIVAILVVVILVLVMIMGGSLAIMESMY